LDRWLDHRALQTPGFELVLPMFMRGHRRASLWRQFPSNKTLWFRNFRPIVEMNHEGTDVKVRCYVVLRECIINSWLYHNVRTHSNTKRNFNFRLSQFPWWTTTRVDWATAGLY